MSTASRTTHPVFVETETLAGSCSRGLQTSRKPPPTHSHPRGCRLCFQSPCNELLPQIQSHLSTKGRKVLWGSVSLGPFHILQQNRKKQVLLIPITTCSSPPWPQSSAPTLCPKAPVSLWKSMVTGSWHPQKSVWQRTPVIHSIQTTFWKILAKEPLLPSVTRRQEEMYMRNSQTQC